MNYLIKISIVAFVLAASGLVLADAPLKSALDLSIEQAAEVQEIQALFRKQFSSKRQVFNRESRALRRARIENDADGIAELEGVTEALKDELKAIRLAENEEIRQVLDEEQLVKFEAVIAERRAMHGSSRDADIFDD